MVSIAGCCPKLEALVFGDEARIFVGDAWIIDRQCVGFGEFALQGPDARR
jgi:hypothetical protein